MASIGRNTDGLPAANRSQQRAISTSPALPVNLDVDPFFGVTIPLHNKSRAFQRLLDELADFQLLGRLVVQVTERNQETSTVKCTFNVLAVVKAEPSHGIAPALV